MMQRSVACNGQMMQRPVGVGAAPALTDLLPSHLQQWILQHVQDDRDIGSCRLACSQLRGLLWSALRSLRLHGSGEVRLAAAQLSRTCPGPNAQLQSLSCTLYSADDVEQLQRLLQQWPSVSCASAHLGRALLGGRAMSRLSWPPHLQTLELTYSTAAIGDCSSTASSSSGGGGGLRGPPSAPWRLDCAPLGQPGPGLPSALSLGLAANLRVLDLTISAAAPRGTAGAAAAAAAAEPPAASGAAPSAAAACQGGPPSAGAAAPGPSADSPWPEEVQQGEVDADSLAAAVDLGALAALPALQELRLSLQSRSVSHSSGDFLPAALTRLSIGPRGCGSAWVGPLERGCCPRLAALHLDGLGIGDLTGLDAASVEFLSALTGLTALTGSLADFPLLCFCVPGQLTRLAVVSLGSPLVEGSCLEEPATYLSPGQLESCGATMETLHTWWEPEDGIPAAPLPRLSHLTLKFSSVFQEFAPLLLSPALLPALTSLSLQPSYSSLGLREVLLPLTRLTSLTLCLHSCRATAGFELEGLARHVSLAELVLQGLTWDAFVAEQPCFAELLRGAPRLRALRFTDCYFGARHVGAQLAQLAQLAGPGRRVAVEGDLAGPDPCEDGAPPAGPSHAAPAAAAGEEDAGLPAAAAASAGDDDAVDPADAVVQVVVVLAAAPGGAADAAAAAAGAGAGAGGVAAGATTAAPPGAPAPDDDALAAMDVEDEGGAP